MKNIEFRFLILEVKGLKTILAFLFFLNLGLPIFGQPWQPDSSAVSPPATASVGILDHKNFNQGIIQSPFQLFNGRMAGIGMSTFGNDPTVIMSVRMAKSIPFLSPRFSHSSVKSFRTSILFSSLVYPIFGVAFS